MKVIISHDVDHLFTADHFLKDLILPKLTIRSILQFMNLYGEKISAKECFKRCLISFKKQMNNVHEICDFDKSHNVPSTFFFGMNNGLGMSYKPKAALPYISFVIKQGFEAGVHGVCYENSDDIKSERDKFEELTGFKPSGIRMHYVRRNENTLTSISSTGYNYDSTEFDKKSGCCIKAPYKIGNMWEFPLTIMDGYLPYNFEQAKVKTLEIIKAAENANLEYITILFHDYMFCDAWDQTRKWYEWIIKYFTENGVKFISYKNAIIELENIKND